MAAIAETATLMKTSKANCINCGNDLRHGNAWVDKHSIDRFIFMEYSTNRRTEHLLEHTIIHACVNDG